MQSVLQRMLVQWGKSSEAFVLSTPVAGGGHGAFTHNIIDTHTVTPYGVSMNGGTLPAAVLSARRAFWSGRQVVFAAQPTVYEKLVEITVIDGNGRRHTLLGMEGQTLAQLMEQHVDVLGKNAVAGSPEGRGCVEAHVKVPNELLEEIPAPAGDDDAVLREVADPQSLDAHSRLGSRIVLDKSLDGVVVSVGDIYPWKTL